MKCQNSKSWPVIGQLTTILNSHWLKMITRFCLTKKHPFEYSPTLHLIHSKLAHPLQPGPLQFRVCVVALIMWLWSSKRMLSPAAPLTIKCGPGFKLLVPCLASLSMTSCLRKNKYGISWPVVVLMRRQAWTAATLMLQLNIGLHHFLHLKYKNYYEYSKFILSHSASATNSR